MSPTDSMPGAGGYREVLGIAFPLILSTSSISLMHVVDRVFLSWHSPESLAASLPAGAASWTLLSLFVGTTGYVSTFVSQYDGAGRPGRIGPAIWQGAYFSALATVVLAFCSLLAEPLFRLAGHPSAVESEEVVYFRILVLGGGGPVFSAALSSLYSGRGKTMMVMWVNLGGALLNAVLAYLWIFGKGGFPEWGIFGAGLASVIAPWAMSAFYFGLLFTPENRRRFDTASAWRFDPEIFGRLLRFGLPSGLQFMSDVAAFTVFVLLLGRIGEVELAASNVAFSINTFLFMPMIGLSMGTSVLVGRYLGANQPDLAARSVKSAYWMTVAYMGAFSLALVAWPDLFISIFHPRDAKVDFSELSRLGRNLLYFVAGYSILDASNIVFTSALKGAGDTRFVLLIVLVAAAFVLVGPMYVACVVLGGGVYVAWSILTVYVVVLAFSFWLRYRAGYWRSMRVIEHTPSPGATMSEGPVVET
jgi:MATE family multidrug resistance protein